MDGERLRFDDSVAANVATGDAVATPVGAMIDEIIARTGVDAPPAAPDDADVPADLDLSAEVDLRAARIE